MITNVVNLRVLVVADDILTRAGLAALLADQPGCTVVGQTPAAPDLAEQVPVYNPDVIVWDLGWDSAPALDRLADVGGAGVPVVALCADEADAAEIWAAGVQGVLLRSTDTTRLVAALVAAAQELAVLDPALVPALWTVASVPAAPPIDPLTPREREVLHLLADGLSNRAIAHRLAISEHTVKFHVNAILRKLDVQSRTEAVTQATRLGLIIL